MTVSLRDFIRETSVANPDTPPCELAALVANQTPEEQVHDFYVQALNRFVQDVWRNDRNTAGAGVRRGGRAPSAKVDGIRNEWQQFIASNVAVPGEGWKPLRLCTTDDIKGLIEDRELHIEAVRTQIDHFDRIRAAMVAERVETVGDLSEAVQ